MKLAPRHHRHGLALIIVMVVILALTVLVAGFAYSMKVEMRLAANHNAGSGLEWIGRSGMEHAKAEVARYLENRTETFDSRMQGWAGGPGPQTPDAFNVFEFVHENVPCGDGHFSYKTVDLERRVNINLASPEVIRQALKLMGADASLTPIISDSINDWRDRDHNKHLSGAENDYYLGQRPSYYCKNGPLDDITELLLIQGITPAMFWGPRYASHRNQGRFTLSPSQRAQHEEPLYPIGLVDMFTTHSARYININTVDYQIYQLVAGVDENAARAAIVARAGPDGVDGSGDDVPFRNVGELKNVPGWPPPVVQALMQSGLASTRSATYEVTVDAELYGVRKRFYGLLRRNNPKEVQLLRFYWD